jgi:1-acyl-sn-glycerol-3-phosphate acyltransferase
VKTRGVLTLIAAAVLLLSADLVQRTVLVWLLRLFPTARERILTRWSHLMARLTITIVKGCGGANIADPPTLASGPGMLILMNHQSVLDIPLAFRSVQGGYPRVVTRRRYARGKPLVSHMLKVYDHPIVDPGAPLEPQMKALEAVARECRQPLLVYPEGTRTRDGQIGPFRTSGLRAILRARPWSVHLLVADGFWRTARMVDFMSKVDHIRGRVTALGPFAWTGPEQDPDRFIQEMRERMAERLLAMRQSDPESPPSPALQAIVRRWTLQPISDDARRFADRLVSIAPSTFRALLFFGSRLVGTNPDAHSAYDFVVVVADAGGFYRDLEAAGHLRRSPRLLAFLNRLLTPNVIAFRPSAGPGPGAKCLVLTEADLARSVSARARDHFVLGRLSQCVAIAWAADEEVRGRMLLTICVALRRALDWAGPRVSAPFTAESFARQAIVASYAGEIRPEAAGRGSDVADAQVAFLREAYGQVLQEAAEAGRLTRDSESYVFARLPTDREVARVRRYFRRSKARATLRWFKYILTFEDWLDYIVQKAERRTGTTIVLTPLQRRLPLLFLWPKVFQVLRSRDISGVRGGPPESATPTGSAP